MKTLFSVIILLAITFHSRAQESMATVMEKRAREMHRVINLNDKQEWIRFIKENYTQALIDKQQTMKVQSSENGNTTTSKEEMKEADKLEAKAKMFARLHQDFSGSKSLRSNQKTKTWKWCLTMVMDLPAPLNYVLIKTNLTSLTGLVSKLVIEQLAP